MRSLTLIAGLLFCTTLAAGGGGDPGASMSWVLNRASPEIRVPLADLNPGSENKFVYVRVVEVTNPDRIALAFSVHFLPMEPMEPKEEEPVFLGNFALFPADNPGEFIIPTQGKLAPGGTITITMELPENSDPSTPVQVEIDRPGLLDTLEKRPP